jgi:hypothetical protein
MQASAARPIRGAIAVVTFVAALGAAPTIPPATGPTATDVLARVTERDALLDSYTVPVHMDIRVHKLLTFHIGLNGTQYYKRPDRLALDIRQIPVPYRKLFADLGTPLTWPGAYDLKLVGANGERGPFRLEGVPRHPSDVARMVIDVDGPANAPLHAQWTMRDGGTIDMRITEESAGGYELPRHADADMAFGGFKIHASIDYGPYSVNEAVADTVFGGS